MFKFVALATLLAVVSAQNFNGRFNPDNNVAPLVTDDPDVQAHDVDVRADGFQYGFALRNGIATSAAGDQAGNHQGSYQWTSPEGTPVRVDFVADENGYRASGDVLPTPPPIPDAILRSLEYIRTHPSQESRQGASRQFLNQGQFLGQGQQFLNDGQF